MKILKVEKYSLEDLIRNLRRVTIYNKPEVSIYARSKITYIGRKAEEVIPCQRFVSKENLDRIKKTEFELMRHGIDPFNLNGYVRIWFEGKDEPTDYLPPICEWAEEERVFIVNDGFHRLYSAYLARKTIGVILISGIDPAFPNPSYSLPFTNPWEMLDLFKNEKEIPETYIKRWYRVEDPKSLYRDYSSRNVFANITAPEENEK